MRFEVLNRKAKRGLIVIYSFAGGLKALQGTPNPSPLTYSNCNNATGTLLDPEYYIPAGLINPQVGANQFRCCGPCNLDVRRVRGMFSPRLCGLIDC